MNIRWRGERVTNYYSNRYGYTPKAIVNHISVGTMESMYNWFSSPNNNRASAHFGIGRNGEIHQYIDLIHAAWTQGIPMSRLDKVTAPFVRERAYNPNVYCVSIEFEGYEGHGINGDITEDQFYAGLWLHKYIQTKVEEKWGYRIPLNSHQVLGHYQIDPTRKPFCPGPKFPWNRMYAELAKIDGMTIEETEEYIRYLSTPNQKRVTAYAIAERVLDLEQTLDHPIWGTEAYRKVMLLSPVMEPIMKDEVTAESICKRILGLYKTAQHPENQYSDEAVRKILLLEPVMKEKGII